MTAPVIFRVAQASGSKAHIFLSLFYSCFQEPIKPLEKRALNFLVNEFLLKNNYKLTSITFSDENDDQVKLLFSNVCF